MTGMTGNQVWGNSVKRNRLNGIDTFGLFRNAEWWSKFPYVIGHTEPNKDDDLRTGWYVLILVLMEDTLGEGTHLYYAQLDTVLILVLMEDTLGVCGVGWKYEITKS